MISKRSLGVHSGTFHADEVTAAAFLILFDLIDEKSIRRTRDLKVLSECEYVCDVGGIYDPSLKRFDHHQVDYQGKLSSAGMILLYLKEIEIIDPELYEMYNQSLVIGVDAHDNGVARFEVGTTSFSQIISNFLPIEHSASNFEMDEAFFQAVSFVHGHLKRMRERFLYTKKCKDLVKKVMDESQEVMMFDESIPWMDSFFEMGGKDHPAKFLIMPSQNHWKLRGIPPNMQERMQVRVSLPEKWGGLLGEDLSSASKIKGAVFCHKGLFISIWETKEAAIEALKQVLHDNGI